MLGLNKKFIQVFSNGSLNFNYNSFNDLKQFKFYEKDSINFHLNSKKNVKFKVGLFNKSKMNYSKKFFQLQIYKIFNDCKFF